MKAIKIAKRITAVIFLAILITTGCIACSSSETESHSLNIDTVEGLKEYLVDKEVAFKTGTLFDKLAPEWFPNSEYMQFNTESDAIAAIMNGKSDAYLTDKPMAEEIERGNSEIRMSDAILMPDSYGFIMSLENTKLRDDFNEMLNKFKEDGTLDMVLDKWCNATDRTLPDINLTGENGTIKVATTATASPFSYSEGGTVIGYDIDLLTRFCELYGYNYEIQIMDFAAIIPAIVSGKCDIGMDSISITDERKKSVNFTDSYYEAGAVAILSADAFGNDDSGDITSLAELQEAMRGKRVAAISGSVQEKISQELFPDSEIIFFLNVPDVLNALEMDKADVYFNDLASFESYKGSNPSTKLKAIDSFAIDVLECGFVFKKDNTKLCGQMDEFIKKHTEDGTMKEVYDKWQDVEKFETVSDKYTLTGENGVLRVATSAANQPFEFMMDNEITGEEIELIYMFCEEYGYGIEIIDMDFSGILASVQTSKADIGAHTFVRTPEREEQVLFSDAIDSASLYAIIGSSMAAADGGESGITSFFSSIGESFKRTFITENRWQLILKGLAITLIISVLSCIFGTILGFGICMANRSRYKLLSVPAKVIIRIIQGTPIVVILMILYFIVFGDIEPVIVAVAGFSINFGVYVSEMMRTGIDAVDRGQTEAASAIGFTRTQAFIQIVMPQAAKHFLPVFRGEFISMVKMTSVVGYISIQDLTKMSDIIRSRTYEAFFPLIATAIIYFLLSWLLTLFITYVEIKIDPKHRRRSIKGVQEHD